MQMDNLEDLQMAVRNISQTTGPIVLRVHAEWCERCPAVGEVMREVQRERLFELFEVDAAEAGEVLGHFKITKLPAVVVLLGGDDDQSFPVQAVTPDQARALLCTCTQPRFSLDEDF